MAKFIVRRFILLLLTMFLVSVAVFLITESSPGNVARNVLGAFVTPEQEASFLAQMGLDAPISTRYLFWFTGSDWLASRKVERALVRAKDSSDPRSSSFIQPEKSSCLSAGTGTWNRT